MPNENSEQPRWRHSENMDVLKKLGIVDRSHNSVSEGENEIMEELPRLRTQTANSDDLLLEDTDDDESLFDKTTLLRRRQSAEDGSTYNRRSTMTDLHKRRTLCCRGFLVAIAFFIVGLCVSIIGPTLGNIQSFTKTRSFGSAVTIVSANGFGALLGVVIGAGCFTLLNTYCVVLIALFLCSVATLIVPWCSTLSGATMVFMLQGVTLGCIERGCYSIFYAYWKRRHFMLILFYTALAFGATISPMITSPFLFHRGSDDISNSSLIMDQHTSPMLRRVRSIDNGSFSSCNDTSDSICNATSSAPLPPFPRKPKINDATNVDHQKTNTEKKIEAEEKQQQQQASTVKIPTTISTNLSTAATQMTSTVSTTTVTPTTTTASTSTRTTTTSSSSTSTTTSASTTTDPPETEISTTDPPESTVPTVTATATASMFISLAPEEWSWDYVREQFGSLNSFQLAYVVIAVISMALTFIFASVCCVMGSCRSAKIGAQHHQASSNGDYRFHLSALRKSRHNQYAVATSALYAFLLSGMEATASSLLTIYCMWALGRPQTSGVMLTSTYWFCVAVSRLFASCWHRRLNNVIPTSVCLGAALVTSGVMVVFPVWTVVLLGLSVLALFTGALVPTTFCWLDQQLTPAPWFATVWCLACELSRTVVPFCAATAMYKRDSPKDFLFALLVISLLACICYAFLRSTVREAARLNNVDQAKPSYQVKFGGANADGLFDYGDFPENSVERDEDEVTYFDRRVPNGRLFDLGAARLHVGD